MADDVDVEIVENCQVEWHKARGVLYVHNKDTGATIIRICGLSTEPEMLGFLNVGHMDITQPRVVYPPAGTE